MFSVLTTPLYVAILTYHYELIPKELLETLIISRSKVPFPPLIEALFLEITIELLREAGARLPTKVGLTVGYSRWYCNWTGICRGKSYK
ncbi:spore germination protein QA [Bacillus cereus]|nr:spore germination protein QA [Bacillus cereus]